MPDFILLMHDDTTTATSPAQWNAYFTMLRASGAFDGGSSIGSGEALRKSSSALVTTHLAGFIRVHANNLDEAKRFVAGNPTYECGGTVEVRALPKD